MSEINLYNRDCMEAMAEMKDNQYDLAIVDPPYFHGPEQRGYYGRKVSSYGVKRRNYKAIQSWDIPNANYFNELFRVSKNQIVWGCNYFQWQFTPGRIIWDKVNGKSSFSDGEEAFCSLFNSMRIFKFKWHGMMQGSCSDGEKMEGNKALQQFRIHPTEKPSQLYRWLLKNYAKQGDKILDTHGGSMSIAIACHDMGFDLDCYELDSDYFTTAKKRFEIHVGTKGQSLFTAEPILSKQTEMFGDILINAST